MQLLPVQLIDKYGMAEAGLLLDLLESSLVGIDAFMRSNPNARRLPGIVDLLKQLVGQPDGYLRENHDQGQSG